MAKEKIEAELEIEWDYCVDSVRKQWYARILWPAECEYDDRHDYSGPIRRTKKAAKADAGVFAKQMGLTLI